MDPVTPSRRRFLADVARLSLGGASLLLVSCMISDSGSGPGPNPVVTDKVGLVSDNHQHDALLTLAQLQAGEGLVLHILGKSDHDHFVYLTSEDIAAIRNGRKLVRTSTNDWGHEHTVTFNWAA